MGILVVLGIFGILALLAFALFGGAAVKSVAPGSGGDDNDKPSVGVVVESLSVTQINRLSRATEGSNDLEFWDKGADVKDTTLSARETLTLSSGAVTDTSVPSMKSSDDDSSKDLYIDGGATYYDQKVDNWEIQYNEQTGKGVVVADGPSGAVEATAVGAFADMDTADAVETGFVQSGAGTINYSLTSGDGTAYIRLAMGNDNTNTVLKDVVFCIGDSDGDLEGDELSSLSISRYSGESIGDVPANALPLFTAAAGTSSFSCQKVGDIVNEDSLKKGVYQINFGITEANFADTEEFEISMDDLGGWKARQYPSRNLKATAEDVTIQRTA